MGHRIGPGSPLDAAPIFDPSYAGSEGRLTWASPARTFVLRTGNDRELFAWPARGVVFDIVNLKTGWCYIGGGGGVVPQWQWNRNKNHFEPQPSERYKRGFSLRCAIGGGKTAMWEQSGTASWNCLAGLGGEINAEFAENPGKLLLVGLVGVRVEKYKKGSTAIPTLRGMLWVDRPACLGGKETFDTVVANADAERRARAAIYATEKASGSRYPNEF